MKKLTMIILLVVCMAEAHAQDYIYGLYRYATMAYNPAEVGKDNAASISYIHQEAEVGPGVVFNHNFISGEYPFVIKSGKRYGGIGFSFLEKDAGNTELLKTQALGMSLAYSMQIAKNQYISYGIRGSYFNKRTSVENITTGNQWIAAEFRYDPSAALGESISENNVNYIGLDAGALWTLVSARGDLRAFMGGSIINVNKPNDSFFEGQTEIPLSYLFNLGANIYENQRIQIFPQFFYLRDGSVNTFSTLVSTKVFFRNNNPYDILLSGNLEMIAKYDFNQDATFGVVFNQPNVSLGFSYNFPLSGSDNKQYLNGGSEFGITLSKTLWAPKPKQVVIDNSTPGRARDFYFNKTEGDQPAQTVVAKSDVDIIQENIEELSEVESLEFKLSKDFKFAFGEAKLDEPSRAYLDEFVDMLAENPDMRLKVVGHTDNVGSNQTNYRLSLQRAEAVTNYLISKGVSADKLEATGMGDTQPLAENDTEENRSKNRRVEFIIYINQ